MFPMTKNLLHDQIAASVHSDFERLKDKHLPIVSMTDVSSLISRLKARKADGNTGLNTDCLTYGTEKLCVLLSMLFSCILTHGTIPSEFMIGSMTPIPKTKGTSDCSDKYRAITLGSCIGRILDLILLEREGSTSLNTNDLQLGFKRNCSTTLCTGLLKEVVSHFVNGGSNVYSVFLDASKAFDRVEFSSLFTNLLQRKVNTVYLRCLLHMYTNQKLLVKWNGHSSDLFTVKNGIKQGGILSPLLFGTYMDTLFSELANTGKGCYIGPYFVGALGYADDISLLSPSLEGLDCMINQCESYAERYHILFNGAKSQLVKFCRKGSASPQREFVTVNGTKVFCSPSVVHLGHNLFEQIDKDDLQSVINSFNRQFNMFRARFYNVPANVRNKLFFTYCTSFYGVQICDLGRMNRLHTAYRKAVRGLWRLPYRTHCRLIPGITENLCSVHMCVKRFLKFAIEVMTHKFPVVQFVFKNAMKLQSSLFKSNVLYCLGNLELELESVSLLESELALTVTSMCSRQCFSREDLAVAKVIQELSLVREGHSHTVFDRLNATELINYLSIS